MDSLGPVYSTYTNENAYQITEYMESQKSDSTLQIHMLNAWFLMSPYSIAPFG
jgi:hypothetical protein